jgi:hypothetical protein
MIYTYLPFFLRTLLHPSHSFLTDDRTFMPRVCCCIRRPVNRAVRLVIVGEAALLLCRHGRAAGVWIARVMVGRRAGVERKVRRSGRREVRASIVAVWDGRSWEVRFGARERNGRGTGLLMGVRGEVLGPRKSECTGHDA